MDNTSCAPGDSFTCLNLSVKYSDDQISNIYVFSLLYQWLFYLYHNPRVATGQIHGVFTGEEDGTTAAQGGRHNCSKSRNKRFLPPPPSNLISTELDSLF